MMWFSSQGDNNNQQDPDIGSVISVPTSGNNNNTSFRRKTVRAQTKKASKKSSTVKSSDSVSEESRKKRIIKWRDTSSMKYQILVVTCLFNSLMLSFFVIDHFKSIEPSSSISSIISIFPGSSGDKNTEEFLRSLKEPQNENKNLNVVDGTENTNNENKSSVGNKFNYPMLPQRIYTIVGLESSGTSFTARAIKMALGIRKTREAHKYYPLFPQERERTEPDLDSESDPVQVQHFSLPWGSSCDAVKETPIVDVVLPTPCTRDHQDNVEHVYHCNAMADELFGFRPNGKPVQYPPRYNLDIVSHKMWYDAHGVDQWIVIVMRDPDISAAARRSSHCKDLDRLKEEEEAGTDIILDAINKFVLGVNERRVTRDTYKFWYAKNFNSDAAPGVIVKKNVRGGGGENQEDRRKLQMSPVNGSAGTLLPKGDNVVLVSYESMLKLGDLYLKMLFEALEIETDYIPHVKNGNSKYVKTEVEK